MRNSGENAARSYLASAEHYQLLEEVGYGAHAVVHRAVYLPRKEVVAVKRLDLDRCNSSLDDVRREAQTMRLIDHPNVVKLYCSFVVEHYLWVVMPFMAEGSCLHLMKIAYPDGFEEPIIGSILKETLKALEYLHSHGHIHRDVKAGNILVDKPGIVKLADFGVSACMFDKGDRQRSRNTFVGTPCWMAPEVLQPGAGYNFKADIWSFGITALELAHGHAPFSKFPPMKVLLMTLQNAPPGLDYERDKRFSKSFKEMVAMCLVKDQTKRPTAQRLLKHSFFKNAKPLDATLKNILADLPPLWDRVKELQLKDAAQLALKRMPSSEQEALSQSEYQRGVSAWEFDVDYLKAQASMILDDSDPSESKDNDEMSCSYVADKDPSSSTSNLKIFSCSDEINCEESNSAPLEHSVKGSNMIKASNSDPSNEVSETRYCDMQNNCKSDADTALPMPKEGKQQAYSGPIVPSIMLGSLMVEREQPTERLDQCGASVSEKPKPQRPTNFSGPLILPKHASANSFSAPIRTSGGYVVDKPKSNAVQIKGRFSVTSENVDPAVRLLKKSASVGSWSINSKTIPKNLNSSITPSSLPTSLLMPHVQNLVQQTSFQQELVMSILNSLQQYGLGEASHTGAIRQPSIAENNNTTVDTNPSENEVVLLQQISELQVRISALTDELIAAKIKHVQLEQELAALQFQEAPRPEG